MRRQQVATGEGSCVEVTGTAQRSAWAENVLPPVERLREGLWSIPVPVSTGVMRYTNVYVFESGDGVTLVDAGWDDDAAWRALCDGLRSIGFAVEDVRRVLVTHAHRDHYGQAARVRRASGAWLAMHADEAAALPGHGASIDVLKRRTLDWMARCGVPADDGPAMMPAILVDSVDMPEPDVKVRDGAVLQVPGWRLRAILTPGHTPGHLTYYEENLGLILTGDHVLPRVTPNVSVNPRQMDNMLGHYLDSLDKLGGLRTTEVLPAHEYRFRGLDARLAELKRHHADRLAHVRDRVADADGSTAWAVCAVSKWSRAWSEMGPQFRRLALGETVSHLMVLEQRGDATRRTVRGVEVWHGTRPGTQP